MAEYINREDLKFLEIPIAPVLQGEQVHYEQGILKEWLESVHTADVIEIPKGATNGDMVEKIFGKDVYFTLIRMMYSSCCEKLKNWWDAPYKRGNENG